MNIVNLTRKLITIPSYFNENNNEQKVADFIFNYLKTRTGLILNKIYLENGRYNIFAYSKECLKNNTIFPDVLFIDHIDTVEPKKGWRFEQFKGTVIKNALYGLGSYDSKGNVAVLMKLAEIVSQEKIAFLFYVDEEYNFIGIKRFIEKYQSKLKPKGVVSTDGKDLSVINACRGLVEMDIEFFGQSGHSALPSNGINAIEAATSVIEKLKNILKLKKDPLLGATTVNVAYINGGLLIGKNGGIPIIGRNGNNIADYAQVTIEFRTNSFVNLDFIKRNLENFSTELKVKINVLKVTHNLNCWATPASKLQAIKSAYKKTGVKFKLFPPSKFGYIDLVMLYETFKVPCFCIGAKGGNGHGVNEFVEIQSLYDLHKILFEMVKK